MPTTFTMPTSRELADDALHKYHILLRSLDKVKAEAEEEGNTMLKIDLQFNPEWNPSHHLKYWLMFSTFDANERIRKLTETSPSEEDVARQTAAYYLICEALDILELKDAKGIKEAQDCLRAIYEKTEKRLFDESETEKELELAA